MSAARVAAALFVVALAALAACVTSSSAANAGPLGCARDLDCAGHHYCSDAGVCTTDCFVDADCLGPTATAQCNAQGRCIETNVDAAASPADAGGG